MITVGYLGLLVWTVIRLLCPCTADAGSVLQHQLVYMVRKHISLFFSLLKSDGWEISRKHTPLSIY
jgi:hypothetical protein